MNQLEFNQIFIKAVSRPSEDLNKQILPCIKKNHKLPARDALKVYQEDYQYRLLDALKNTYKATHFILGDEDFSFLCFDYIKTHFSTSPDLDDYGESLSIFSSKHELGDSYIFLTELLAFEWQYRLLFHHAHQKGLESNSLLSSPNRTITLVESHFLFESSFAIRELFNLKDHEESDHEFDFKQPQCLLLLKNETRIVFQLLSKGQFEIMKKLQGQTTLGELVQNAPANLTPDEIQDLFAKLAEYRMIKFLD